jgi:carboxypeptidase Taq
MDFESTLKDLHRIDREFGYLEKAAAALQWDQETYLPPQGVADRAEQLALMEGLAHERLTSTETGRLLEALGSTTATPRGDAALAPVERDFCRVLRRAYDRAVKLPPEFVADLARAEGHSQAAWVRARRTNNFAAFMPHLQGMIDMARKKAEYWGASGAGVYDALLDIYEPGISAAGIAALFGPLGERLSALIKKIARRPPPDAAFLDQDYPVETQARYCRDLLDSLGFDFSRGRLDISAHPFTTTLGFDDVRITTRYFPRNVLSGIFSTIHEAGHAFYELNIAPELRGSSLAGGTSMGIHESQSRLWENIIGRSRAFWTGQYPRIKTFFPDQLAAVDADTFYRAVNRVQPSLIRVEADEVSYGLHIILRFELEKRLFAGDLAVENLPEAWRSLMKELLGVEPPTDAEGVLQDVHWSMGSFGYFPSYFLGNLYGLQFWKKLREDLPDVETAISRGQFDPLYSWLRDHIHRWGSRLEPAELLRTVTGEALSMHPFLDYIEAKYTELYAL